MACAVCGRSFDSEHFLSFNVQCKVLRCRVRSMMCLVVNGDEGHLCWDIDDSTEDFAASFLHIHASWVISMSNGPLLFHLFIPLLDQTFPAKLVIFDVATAWNLSMACDHSRWTERRKSSYRRTSFRMSSDVLHPEGPSTGSITRAFSFSGMVRLDRCLDTTSRRLGSHC